MIAVRIVMGPKDVHKYETDQAEFIVPTQQNIKIHLDARNYPAQLIVEDMNHGEAVAAVCTMF